MSQPTPFAQLLAADATAIGPADVPAAVFAKAALCLTDYFSSAFAAQALPWSRQAVATLRPQPTGSACIALGGYAAASDAAFANAVAAHGLVREDMHTGSIAHLGIVVWPALLAALPDLPQPVSGRALLTAAIVGYEAGAALGRVLMTAELARLFRPTGLVGPVAATVAVGHLYGLSSEAMAVAISLAVNCAGGLNQWPGSGGSEMYFHAGFAARNALSCVALARAGAFASPDIFEGQAGLFQAFARRSLDQPIRLFAGGHFEILDVFHKQAPACNFAQTPSQAALQARLKLAGDSRDIVGVEIAATRAALLYPGCDATGPFANVLQAKMSIQFGVAAALARGCLDAGNYTKLDDPEILRLMAVTVLAEDPALTAAYPQRQPARVRLTVAQGDVVTAALDDVQAAPDAMVRARFLTAASDVLGTARAAELAEVLGALLTIPTVDGLNALQISQSP